MTDAIAATGEPLLDVRGLTLHYSQKPGLFHSARPPVRAVDDVSFQLRAGETFGVVGESGCGKSSLLRALLMLEPPTGGTVRFAGRSITPGTLGDFRRRVQIIFQDPYTSLPPRMRVRDIIADPLRIHGLGSAREVSARVTELMREVGLDPDRAGEYPFQFSGGQRQRIGIARALAVNPSLLMLDEAVSALDVSVQAQVLNLLRDLQDRLGLAYVFISHDLNVVQYMSNRIAVMYLGQVVEEASAEKVTGEPLHPYTVALLSAVPTVGGTRGSRVKLGGEPPKPTDPPPGCRFHPRCPMAQLICAREVPVLREWLPGHRAACHFALDVKRLVTPIVVPDSGGSARSSDISIQLPGGER